MPNDVLIRFAQTNVNYFPLKCDTYKTNNAIWWLDAQAFHTDVILLQTLKQYIWTIKWFKEITISLNA